MTSRLKPYVKEEERVYTPLLILNKDRLLIDFLNKECNQLGLSTQNKQTQQNISNEEICFYLISLGKTPSQQSACNMQENSGQPNGKKHRNGR